MLGPGSVAGEPEYITYQWGWAGWQVYITEQSEGSVISHHYYYVTSYYDVCMRYLGDVSRALCGVTRSFLWEFSCCCGLERDGCMLKIGSKACCVNRYTSVGGIVFGG